MSNKIIKGDCIEQMKLLEENSVDAIVTDPPYGLEFMGKNWDFGVPGKTFFIEMLRVLKPGGFLLSFGGTRTYHRLVCGIEDAGFEIRDTIMWLYGSGFPKSLNIGKQIDKIGAKDISWFGKWLREWREKKNIAQKEIAKLFPSKTGGLTGCIANWELGLNIPTPKQFTKICRTFNLPFESIEEAKREVIGKTENKVGCFNEIKEDKFGTKAEYLNITAPTTQEAKEWEGWGTALKPACEPIVVARKPLSEKNVALNVLKWETGGINIDACRIGHNEPLKETNRKSREEGNVFDDSSCGFKSENLKLASASPQGRFPANIILDEEAGKMLDEQSGISKSPNSGIRKAGSEFGQGSGWNDHKNIDTVRVGHSDKGGASRFFYQAKSSKKERNLGTDSFIKLEVLKVICEENNLTKEERLVELLVDMDTLQKKDIEECGTQNQKDYEWNTALFGKKLMEKYQQDIQSIIKTETNSTIQLKILNWLKHLFINEYTLDANSLKENGGNHVENVEKSKELIITINEKLESVLGVKDVVLGTQLKIRLKDGSNFHPTCKPIKLMEYLIKLVSKENSIVLDPFLGSGTTAIACLKLNRKFIGIEKEEEYVKICEARIKPYLEQTKLCIKEQIKVNKNV